MKQIILLFILVIISSCENKEKTLIESTKEDIPLPVVTKDVSLIILGTIQDAGSPQIACDKDCCKVLFENPDKTGRVVSLGLVDFESQKSFIFEATPDFPEQMKTLKEHASFTEKETPDGVFLTHAHIGHYTGLMYFGKEAMNAYSIPIYAMPKMKNFLEMNGPWSQLVENNNIDIQELSHNKSLQITANLKVTPFTVPHRDEYSETVGYTIEGPNKSVLFIPDIDKWEKWDVDIVGEIAKVDYAFIDATFYDGEEINGRDISEIPHPFIIESMRLFEKLDVKERRKIHFIHFNHTNPMLNKSSVQYKKVIDVGFNVTDINDVMQL